MIWMILSKLDKKYLLWNPTGVGVTIDVCVLSKWGLLTYIKTFESTPYLEGDAAAMLQQHLPNMKLLFTIDWEIYHLNIN